MNKQSKAVFIQPVAVHVLVVFNTSCRVFIVAPLRYRFPSPQTDSIAEINPDIASCFQAF